MPGNYSAATGYFPGGIWQFKQAFDPAAPQSPGHATYATIPIHLGSRDTPGPFPYQNGVNRFPFGGFSRVGDVMHVPFIGGYRIRTVQNDSQNPKTCVETHAVTMDSIRADDANNNDALKPPIEQIGRFCPIDISPVDSDLNVRADLMPKPRYAWANDVLDLFSTTGPADDFLPNIDPFGGFDPTVQGSTAKFPVLPLPVPNGPGTWQNANWGREDGVAFDGRINVNTAHWRVLATVPMIPYKGQANWLQLNVALAKAIVYYRDVDSDPQTGNQPHGPFRSLWELNRVYDVANNDQTKTFQNAWQQIVLTGDLDDDDGDISPVGAGAVDNIPGDFETRFAMVNRVTNLLTTQSDSFTVYAVVQGWRNAGTDTPELVAIRRSAAIIDRSGVYPRRVGLLPPGAPPFDPRTPVSTTSMNITPIPLQQ
jgi:hypothetical protein